MCDKRIVRGNTYASMVVPTTDASNIQKKAKQQAPAKEKEDAKQTRNIPTPEPKEGRKNRDIQTDVRIEEITDKPPQYHISVQTDFYIDRPPSPLFKLKKRGTDIETQIQEGELFDFDNEVEPLINALCSKLMEQSHFEVIEEEELKQIKDERNNYLKKREKELTEAQKQELQEMRKLEEIERRKKQMVTESEKQLFTHKRLQARVEAKSFLSTIKENTLINLEKQGVYRDRVDYQILSKVLPAIYGEVKRINQTEGVFSSAILNILKDSCQEAVVTHNAKIKEKMNSIKAKNDKIAEAKRAKEQLKIKKKEEREEKKKKEAFTKFSEDILTEFFKNGQVITESSLFTQILAPPHGFYLKKPIVGTAGGMMFDIVSILSQAVALKGSSDFLNEKSIMMFVGNFLTKDMKCDSFPIIMSEEIMKYLKEHSLTVAQINEPEGSAMNEIAELIKSSLLKGEFENMLMSKKTEFGFNEKVMQLLVFAFMRLITKKQKDPEMRGRTNAARDKLKLLSITEEFATEQRKPKAMLVIKSKPHEEEEEDPPEDKKLAKGKVKEAEEIKVTLVNPFGASASILVLHIDAWRMLRDELLESIFTYFQSDLQGIEKQALKEKVDEISAKQIEMIKSNWKLPIFEMEQ